MSLYSVIGGLRSDVEGRIQSLTPNAFPGSPFVRRPANDRKERKIRDAIGRDRLFEMGGGTLTGEPAIGYPERVFEMTFPITITYKDTEDWRRAAMDDADEIAQDLRTNGSTVSGVDIREISPEELPTIEENDEDPWFYLTLNLYALVRVT